MEYNYVHHFTQSDVAARDKHGGIESAYADIKMMTVPPVAF